MILQSHPLIALGSKCGLLLFAAIMLSSCLQRYYKAAEHDDPVATVDGGKIEGVEENGLLVFRGIPYAAPPVGKFRWRQPMPVIPWEGVRACKSFEPDPMQFPTPGDQAELQTEPNEDCLYLNIWRPGKIPIGKKCPVVIWIHGGGGVNGGSSAPIYEGRAFAKSGTIFVSFNYRLGRFGYFAHPALAAADEGPTGNFALMDQIAALEWIQRNIIAFGGDPLHVTLMGESAGGRAVLQHLLNFPQKRLFHAAVVMSGGGRDDLIGGSSMAEAEQAGINFATAQGIEGSDTAALAALRALPAEKVRGELNMSFIHHPDSTYCGGPIYDSYLLKSSVEQLLLSGDIPRIPLLIGTTGDEIELYKIPKPDNPFSVFGADSDKAKDNYFGTGAVDNQTAAKLISADYAMQEPARFLARQATKAQAPVWLYRFDYVAHPRREAQMHAPHASEIPFAFNTLHHLLGDELHPNDSLVVHAFHQIIASFAHHGEPTFDPIEGIPNWPPYNLDNEQIMYFGNEGAKLIPDPLKERLDLIEKLHTPKALQP